MSKDFDKIFKSKLENHSSSFPTDMWDNIDAAINPPKRNNRVWWLSFLFIGVIGFVGSIFYLNTSQELDTLAIVNTDGTLSGLSTNQNVELFSNLSSTLETVKVNKDYQNENQVITTNEESEVTDRSIDSNVANTEVSNKTVEIEDLNFENKSIKLAAQEINAFTNQLTVKSINKRKITFTEPLLSAESQNNSPETKKVSLYNDEGLESNETRFTNVLNPKVKSWLDKDKFYGNKQLSFKDIASLPGILDLSKYSSRPSLDLDVSVPPGLDCPSWVREKLGLYLEAYYAPEYGLRSFTAKDRDSTIMAHQDARNNTEKALISYSLGARALFLTPSGISFKLGINYSQINERFTWQDPESIREITIVDTDPMTGDTLSTYVTYEYGTDVEERINKYKSIDLALLLGYEKHYRKNLSFSVNAGIYLNMLAKQRGMFLDPNGDRSWFSSDDGTYDVYKRSVGVSFFASGGLMYHWVDGIDFFAEPSLRFYTQSITLNDYPLNQNYVFLGLHTGIRYKF